MSGGVKAMSALSVVVLPEEGEVGGDDDGSATLHTNPEHGGHAGVHVAGTDELGHGHGHGGSQCQPTSLSGG